MDVGSPATRTIPDAGPPRSLRFQMEVKLSRRTPPPALPLSSPPLSASLITPSSAGLNFSRALRWWEIVSSPLTRMQWREGQELLSPVFPDDRVPPFSRQASGAPQPHKITPTFSYLLPEVDQHTQSGVSLMPRAGNQEYQFRQPKCDFSMFQPWKVFWPRIPA